MGPSLRINGIVGAILGGMSMACGGAIATDGISASGGARTSVPAALGGAGSGDAISRSTDISTGTDTGTTTQSSVHTIPSSVMNTYAATYTYSIASTGEGTSLSSSPFVSSVTTAGTSVGTITFIGTQTLPSIGTGTARQTLTSTALCTAMSTSVSQCVGTVTFQSTNTQAYTSTSAFVQTDTGTDAGSCGELDGGTLPPASSITQLTLAPHCTSVPSVSPVFLASATQAQAIYQLTRDLSAIVPGSFSCSAKASLSYDLVFSVNDGRRLQATMELSGCFLVSIDGEPCNRMGSPAYFLQVDQVLGSPASTTNVGRTNDFLNFEGTCRAPNDGDGGASDAGYDDAGQYDAG